MKKTDELHELIHSLSRNEKGYFKKFASAYKDRDRHIGLRLYDLLEAMPEYDEERLQEQLSANKPVQQLAVYKNHLYHLVLKSLEAYHANTTVQAEIYALLRQIDILYGKSLFRQAMKLARKAEKLAEQYAYPEELLLVNERIMNLLRKINKGNKLSEELLFERTQLNRKLTEDIHTRQELSGLANRLMVCYRRLSDPLYPQPEIRQEIERIINDALLQKEPEEPGACMAYHKAWLIYSGKQHRHEESCRHSLEVLNTIKKMGRRAVQERLETYMTTLYNLLLSSVYCHNTMLYKKHLAEMKTLLPECPPDLQEGMQVDIFNLQMAHGILTGQVRALRPVMQELEERLLVLAARVQKYQSRMLLYNSASVYLLLEEYSLALRNIQLLLNELRDSPETNLRLFASLYEIILHYELGNYDVLEYQLTAFQRMLRAAGKGGFAVEELFLKYLRKLAAVEDRSEKQNLYAELATALLTLQPEEQYRKSYFNFLHWAQSKATGVKFIDFIEGKK